jgi:putative lipoic acid-binding regulatory protein
MIQEKEIKYPVTIALKVIMTSDAGDEKNISDLNKILSKFDVPLKKEWIVSKSNAGNYMCYTGRVYIASKDIMYMLFEELRKHQGVKFAI